MSFVDNHCHLIADGCSQWVDFPDGVARYHRSLHAEGLTPADVDWTHHFDSSQLLQTLQLAADLGLRHVTETGFGLMAEWDALQSLHAQDSLPLSVHLMALSGLADSLGPRSLASLRTHDAHLDITGVKFYADGWLGPRTCAMREPFADEPNNSGVLFLNSVTLARRAAPYAEADLKLATHAIGDAAVAAAIDAYALIFDTPAECRAAAPRIEHAQVLAPDLVARMAEWGVVACIQPSFAFLDRDIAPMALGPQRMQWAYNWQMLLDAGVKVITGSDYPMAPLSPHVGLEHLTLGPHALSQDTAERMMHGHLER